MVTAIPDLWPAVIEPSPVLTPVVILRQQGVNLGAKTHNIAFGDVETRPVPPPADVPRQDPAAPADMRHTLVISAPLINYRVPLLAVRHGLDPYPASVVSLRSSEGPTQVNGPDELLEALK